MKLILPVAYKYLIFGIKKVMPVLFSRWQKGKNP
jgi:hypothetical protein